MGVWFVCMFLWVIDACGGARYARYGASERVWFGLRTENTGGGWRLDAMQHDELRLLLLLAASAAAVRKCLCHRLQRDIVWPIIAPSGRITVQCLSLPLSFTQTLHQPASQLWQQPASVVANVFKNVRVLDSHAPVCVIFSSSFVHKFTYSLTPYARPDVLCYILYTKRCADLILPGFNKPAKTSRQTDRPP